MKSVAWEVGFAVLAWLLPMMAAVAMYSLREHQRMFFEALIAVALAASTSLLGWLYLRKSAGGYLRQGIRIGIVWMVANWAFDALMFSSGPMKMSLEDYVKDIGVTYLMIPAITIGLGAIATSAAKSSRAQH